MSRVSEVEEFSLKSGFWRYRVEVWHDELHQHRVFEEKEPELAVRKTWMQAQAWDEKHAKAVHLDTAQHTAQQRTAAAEREQEEITKLAATADAASSWDQLVRQEAFREPAPRRARPRTFFPALAAARTAPPQLERVIRVRRSSRCERAVRMEGLRASSSEAMGEGRDRNADRTPS